VERLLSDWQVPGAAVVLVKGGEVLLAGGFGVRDIASGEPVTAQTMFPIASVTKSFTALSCAMLVEEGKLSWEGPVHELMPELEMHDPYVTKHLALRDMLSHRSGLPRYDLLWKNNEEITRRELVERVRHLKPNVGFRSLWQYNNLMYIAAGYLIEKATGQTWEEFISERIFRKLGMASSNFSVEDVKRYPNQAKPHALWQGEVVQGDYLNVDRVGPAGSINSTAEDMAAYLQLHLNRGQYGGERLVSEAMIGEMVLPHMAVPPLMHFKDVSYRTYGLGLEQISYQGHNIVRHGGNINGFSSLMAFVPEEGTGVLVLLNRNAPLNHVIAFLALEMMLGLERQDWSSRYRAEVRKMEDFMEEQPAKLLAERASEQEASLSVADICGRYHHPGFGTLTVRADGKEPELIYNGLSYKLTPNGGDVYVAVQRSPWDYFAGRVTFRDGELSMPFEQAPGTEELVFRKR